MPELGRGRSPGSQQLQFQLLPRRPVGSYPEVRRGAEQSVLPKAAGIRPKISIPTSSGRLYRFRTGVEATLSRSKSALGENIYIKGIPYVVIGVMKDKKQDSSYDGWDVNKVFVPFPVMLEDFPTSHRRTSHQRGPAAGDASLDVQHHEACKHELSPPLSANPCTISIPPTRKPRAFGTPWKKHKPSRR